MPLSLTYQSSNERTAEGHLAEIVASRVPTWESPVAVGIAPHHQAWTTISKFSAFMNPKRQFGVTALSPSRPIPTPMQILVITESRQKLRSWHHVIRLMGQRPCVRMTQGFAFAYPDSLDLLGFRFTGTGAHEFGRLPKGRFADRFQRALRTLPDDAAILIATDDDQEGDVIGFDVIRMIQAHDPSLLSRTLKVRPASMALADLRSAIVEAVEEAMRAPGEARSLYARMEQAAVPGRARAILDRWIGAAYSHDSGRECGRVKAATLAAVRLWSEQPEALRAIPETGEVRLRVAAADGGEAFTARIPLRGPIPYDLSRLAVRYVGTEVPGRIVAAAPAGAAVAPRDGRPPLLNTGDALIAASRHYGLSVAAAMKGLQFGYHVGKISYPRTTERHISEASAHRTLGIARRCGVPGLPDSLREWAVPVPPDGAHEALHPAREVAAGEIEEHFAERQRPRRGVANIMIGIVAEGCFEAMRHNPRAWGFYRPEPGHQLSKDEIAALERLDWTRSEAEPLHRAAPEGTGLRLWPLESIIVDLMMSEGIGRPSTWVNNGHALKVSDWIDFTGDGSPPTLSARGHDTLSRLPPEAADPTTSREIQRILKDRPCTRDAIEPPTRPRRAGMGDASPSAASSAAPFTAPAAASSAALQRAPLPRAVMDRINAVRVAFGGIDARLRAEMLRDAVRVQAARSAAAEVSDDAKASAPLAAQIADPAIAQDDNFNIRDTVTRAEDHKRAGVAQGDGPDAAAHEPAVAQGHGMDITVLAELRRAALAMPGWAEPQEWAAKSHGGAPIEVPDGWPDDAAQPPIGAKGNPPDIAAPQGWADESQGTALIEAGVDQHGGAPIEVPEGWPADAAQALIGAEGDPPDMVSPQDIEPPQDRADEAQGTVLIEAWDNQHGGAPIEEPDGWPGDAAQTPMGAKIDPQNIAAPQGWADESQGTVLIEARDSLHGGAPIEEPDDQPDAAAQALIEAKGEPPDTAPPQDIAAPHDRVGETQGAALIESRDNQHGGAPIEKPDHWPDAAAQAPLEANAEPPDMAPPQDRADEAQDAAHIEARDNQHGGAPIRKPDDGPGAPAPAPIDVPEPPRAAMRAPEGAAGGQPAAAGVPSHASDSPGIANGDPDSVGIQAPQKQHHQQMKEHHAQRPNTQQIATTPQPSHRVEQGSESPDLALQARAARAPEPVARGAHGQKPDLPAQTPQTRAARAPEPDVQGAHGQEMSEPAPQDAAAHGAAVAQGHAVQPVERILREMDSVEDGFVTERVIEQGDFTVWVFEFYTRNRFLDFMEVRDSAGKRHQFKYDERANDMLPVAPDDERADPRIRWRARRATPKPRPPEPDYDYDYDEEYDYDEDCSPGM